MYGVIRTVSFRSRSVSRVLAPITAGTLHPNPRIIGMKDFPCRPILCMIRSIITATRARYPESSRIARSRNISRMFGRNTTTEPTPAMIPSQINETAQAGMLGPRTSPTNTAASPKIVSIHPINGSPTANTIWNTRYITTRNIGKPSHLLVTIRSMRSDWFFPPESLW